MGYRIVRDCMVAEVKTISPKAKFRDILEFFKREPIDALPVVKGGKLMGIITRTDLLRIFLPDYFELLDDFSFIDNFGALEIDKDNLKMMERLLLVEDMMIKSVITVSPEASILKAIVLMKKHGIRNLPVANKEGELIGIISRTDILRAFLDVEES
ncbi:CBS domain-containing protein [bacterium]|nr:CBS domain-containing protein [bacterium]